MAGHQLIEAHLAELRRRLPPEFAEELVDGLTETYTHQLAAGNGPDAAAEAAIAEFGDIDTIVAAFVRQAPGRRAALALLATGPLVGVCWATAFIVGRAWTWPIGPGWRIAFGVTLLTTIAALARAAFERANYQRTRLARPAAAVVMALDLGLITTAFIAAPVLVWPLLLAIPASCVRIGLTSRALAHLR